MMKKMITFFVMIIMVMTLAACGNQRSEDEIVQGGSAGRSSVQEEIGITGDGDNVQVPVPFTEYDTMEAASAAAGFELVLPETAGGLSERSILVYETDPKMIEVVYRDDSDSVTIRKEASGSDDEKDISGVYVDYSEKNTVSVNDLNVTITGEKERVHVASWLHGGCNYSVFSDAGMSESEMLDLIAKIE